MNRNMSEKNFVFLDFDNTLYRGESRYMILDFSTFLKTNGFFDSGEFDKFRSLFSSYHQGELDRHKFGVYAVETYYRGLCGITAKEISAQANLFWDRIRDNAWFPYTVPLLKLLKDKTTTILISGSPIEILKIISKSLGIKDLYASKGILNNGVYSGGTEQEMATSYSKAKLMKGLSVKFSFNPATSFAFGDSESDFPLLEAVDPCNAYLLGASAKLKQQVIEKNWNLLDHENEILSHVNSRIDELFP